jgi:hypothetical protein
VKVIKINGPLSKRLADLALHKADLLFATECLEQLNHTPEEPFIIRQALWRSAIIHFVKCFGDGVRFQLSAEKIYKGDALGLMAVFRYFRDLRNKHFVHDENSYAQSIPGAVINQGNKGYKVEKIASFSAYAETLGQSNYNNLSLLIQTADKWVTLQFDSICDILTKELEAESYETLLRRESLSLTVPNVDQIGKSRLSP